MACEVLWSAPSALTSTNEACIGSLGFNALFTTPKTGREREAPLQNAQDVSLILKSLLKKAFTPLPTA